MQHHQETQETKFHRQRAVRCCAAIVAVLLLSVCGAAQAQPAIQAASLLDFPNTQINSTSDLILSIGNTGSDTLIVSSITTSYAEFTVDQTSVTVPPGDSAVVTVTYAPVSPGQKNKSLTITHNGPSSPTSVSLKGRGLNVAVISVASSVALGNVVVGTSNSTTFQVSNTGSTNLSVTDLSLSGADTTVVAVSPTLFSVAAGASQTVQVDFTPTAGAAYTITATLSHNSGSGTSPVTLTGSGLQPGISTAGSLNAGSVLVGASTTSTLTVSNPGNATLTLSSVTLSGSNAGDFSVSPTALTVAAGGSAALTITFTPAASGVRSATLTVTHDADGGSATVALTGTGTAAPESSVTPARLEVVSSLAFPELPVGTSQSRFLVVRNSGGSNLRLASITVRGANTDDFNLPEKEAVVAPGGVIDLLVTFIPSQHGSRSALLVIEEKGSETVNVELKGVGVAPSVSAPDKLSLGSTQSGTAITATITVGNTGNSLLILEGIGLSGMDAESFSVTPDSARIDPGASVDLLVRFTPVRGGDHTADLVFDYNVHPAHWRIRLDGRSLSVESDPLPDPDDPALTVPGLPPQITVAKEVVLGEVCVGQTSTRQIQVSNTGESLLSFTVSQVGVADSGSVTVDPSWAEVAPGKTIDLTVTYSPTCAKHLDGTLQFDGNGPDNIRQVYLVGGGLQPQLQISADEINLGGVPAGRATSASILIQNPGNDLLEVTQVLVGSTSFSVTPQAFSLEPGEIQLLTVGFVASDPGKIITEVLLEHNAEGAETAVTVVASAVDRIDLDGNGRIDFKDLLIYFKEYRDIRASVMPAGPEHDLETNGRVDFADVLVFMTTNLKGL